MSNVRTTCMACGLDEMREQSDDPWAERVAHAAEHGMTEAQWVAYTGITRDAWMAEFRRETADD